MHILRLASEANLAVAGRRDASTFGMVVENGKKP